MKVKKEAMKTYPVSYKYNGTFALLNRNLITYILLNSFWIFLVLFKFYKRKPHSCKDVIVAWLELLLSTPFFLF